MPDSGDRCVTSIYLRSKQRFGLAWSELVEAEVLTFEPNAESSLCVCMCVCVLYNILHYTHVLSLDAQATANKFLLHPENMDVFFQGCQPSGWSHL